MNAYITLLNFYYCTRSSDIYHSVAECILAHPDCFKNKSIYEMAEQCFVSAATISRFCKKLGYDSYTLFKNSLEQAIIKYSYNNCYVSDDLKFGGEDSESESFLIQIGHYSELLKKTYPRECIKELSEKLHSYPRVGFFSCIPSYRLQYLQADLLLTKHEAVFCQTPQAQIEYARTLDANSITVILKPEPMEVKYMEEIIQILKNNLVKIILISNTKYSKLNMLADYRLCFSGNFIMSDVLCFDMIVSMLSMEYRKAYLSK